MSCTNRPIKQRHNPSTPNLVHPLQPKAVQVLVLVLVRVRVVLMGTRMRMRLSRPRMQPTTKPSLSLLMLTMYGAWFGGIRRVGGINLEDAIRLHAYFWFHTVDCIVLV
jgi:hypothetical protein